MVRPIHSLFIQPCFIAGYCKANQLGNRIMLIHSEAGAKYDQTQIKDFWDAGYYGRK